MTKRKIYIAASAACALVGAALLPGVASAAAPGATDWTGFYAGLNAGGGMAQGIVEDKDCYFCASDSFRTGNFTAGAQAGYNWQQGALVLGLEADVSYSSLDRKGALGLDDTTRISPDETKMQVFGTIRPRAGLAVDNAMIYVTGGAAWAQIDSKSRIFNSYNSTVRGYVNDNSIRWGLAAGAGLEYAVSPNWSIRGEYLYTTYQDVTVDGSSVMGCTGNRQCRISYGLSTQEARIGVNYRFH
jgi:opacity protein-like surface antigen